MFLAAVNFFLGVVGATQVTRILLYRRSLTGAEEEVKAEGREIKEELKTVGAKAEQAVKS